MESHRHCECGKILPPTQSICMECVLRYLEEEDKPRVPYYVNEIEECKK